MSRLLREPRIISIFLKRHGHKKMPAWQPDVRESSETLLNIQIPRALHTEIHPSTGILQEHWRYVSGMTLLFQARQFPQKTSCSFTKNSSSSLLRLKRCFRISILNRISKSIGLPPALDLWSCEKALSRSGRNNFQGIESVSRLRTSFLSLSFAHRCCSTQKPLLLTVCLKCSKSTINENTRETSLLFHFSSCP